MSNTGEKEPAGGATAVAPAEETPPTEGTDEPSGAIKQFRAGVENELARRNAEAKKAAGDATATPKGDGDSSKTRQDDAPGDGEAAPTSTGEAAPTSDDKATQADALSALGLSPAQIEIARRAQVQPVALQAMGKEGATEFLAGEKTRLDTLGAKYGELGRRIREQSQGDAGTSQEKGSQKASPVPEAAATPAVENQAAETLIQKLGLDPDTLDPDVLGAITTMAGEIDALKQQAAQPTAAPELGPEAMGRIRGLFAELDKFVGANKEVWAGTFGDKTTRDYEVGTPEHEARKAVLTKAHDIMLGAIDMGEEYTAEQALDVALFDLHKDTYKHAMLAETATAVTKRSKGALQSPGGRAGGRQMTRRERAKKGVRDFNEKHNLH